MMVEEKFSTGKEHTMQAYASVHRIGVFDAGRDAIENTPELEYDAHCNLAVGMNRIPNECELYRASSV